jgi:predicted molibdopterin-dependent oxidoreductase YjgC
LERRLTYCQLVDPPVRRYPTQSLSRFAAEMGWKDAFYDGAAQIFDEFAALTAGTSCDCSGASHTRLREDGRCSGRCRRRPPGTARLYTAGRFATPNGRARFVAVEHVEPVGPSTRLR